LKTTIQYLFKDNLYITSITKIPFVSGFCNNFIIFRGIESDATSQLVAKVRGHTKELFLITISRGFDNVSLLLPFPFTLNDKSFTMIVQRISDFEFCRSNLIRSGMPLHPQLALTPTIQSPFIVSSDSVVISIVFG